ncbi:F0F1 ATP synthase subunit epsilon [Georgenia sunbinii]|uniref:F0F1 ATP synthase subunit epsilon n=1 Tax=Georgenia sunbinii TaxID=3117728 RepID=UPI002F26BF30
MTLSVHIVGPEATLWQGEATSVSVPAADGELGIRPGRQPVLAVLRPGTVRVIGEGGSSESVDILGGFVSVDDDDITVVVDSQDEHRADEH